MVFQPTTSEIREANRSFNEVYDSLNAPQKIYLSQVLNSIKVNLTKKDWARWLRNKKQNRLDEAIRSLNLFIIIVLLFTAMTWMAIFFKFAGNSGANFIIIAVVYCFLFAQIVSYKNAISMLHIEIDKIDVEVVAIDEVIRKTSTLNEVRDVLDDFLKYGESDGHLKAQEIYLPVISLSIASMIKSEKY